jgi:hypothetical protein
MNRPSSVPPFMSREQYEHASRLIRDRFVEMPGLVLTSLQAERLFGIDESMCIAIMDELVTSGFLEKAHGGYTMPALMR